MNLRRYISGLAGILLITGVFVISTSFDYKKENRYGKIKYAAKPMDTDGWWFFVRMQINEKENVYEIQGTSNKLVSGPKVEFEKAIWWGIARRQLAIGPFETQAEAMNAKILYKKKKDDITEIPMSQYPEEVFWFLMTFKQLKRTAAYQFERMPARVVTGTVQEFRDALYEGITFQNLVIGPFWDYNKAEEAKAMYRKNE